MLGVVCIMAGVMLFSARQIADSLRVNRHSSQETKQRASAIFKVWCFPINTILRTSCKATGYRRDSGNIMKFASAIILANRRYRTAPEHGTPSF